MSARHRGVSGRAALPARRVLLPSRRAVLPSRRAVLATALGGASLLGIVSGCGTGSGTGSGAPSTRPRERSVGFGFESVVAEDVDYDVIAERLVDVEATAVGLAVGRVDWTAFPWDAHQGAASSRVASTGRDYVAEMIQALDERARTELDLTLTIDTLAPALLAEHPDQAGIGLDGERSDSFPSVSALESGLTGDLLVALADEVCARYRPQRVALTELMFDDATFGGDDLDSFRAATGRQDWPRRDDGGIDPTNPALGAWRAGALATLLARVQDVVHDHGVELEMDVRAPWRDPHGDRAQSGHDYELLLEHADRIAVWNYFALDGRTPADGAEIARSLTERFPGRVSLSTGLWAPDGTISGAALAESLELVHAAGAEAASVTPYSLMTDEHWEALTGVWS